MPAAAPTKGGRDRRGDARPLVVVLDSTADYRGLLRNLAFSLSLYSGQMCTTPQNILVSRDGVDTDAGRRSPEEFAADLVETLPGGLDVVAGHSLAAFAEVLEVIARA